MLQIFLFALLLQKRPKGFSLQLSFFAKGSAFSFESNIYFDESSVMCSQGYSQRCWADAVRHVPS